MVFRKKKKTSGDTQHNIMDSTDRVSFDISFLFCVDVLLRWSLSHNTIVKFLVCIFHFVFFFFVHFLSLVCFLPSFVSLLQCILFPPSISSRRRPFSCPSWLNCLIPQAHHLLLVLSLLHFILMMQLTILTSILLEAVTDLTMERDEMRRRRTVHFIQDTLSLFFFFSD